MEDDDYIVRRDVEKLMVHHADVEANFAGIVITGIIDGMGQHGFWIRPSELTYIPYADCYGIKRAVE